MVKANATGKGEEGVVPEGEWSEKAPWRGAWESPGVSGNWRVREEGSWGAPGERATFEGRPGDGFGSTQRLQVEGFLLLQVFI